MRKGREKKGGVKTKKNSLKEQLFTGGIKMLCEDGLGFVLVRCCPTRARASDLN